MTLKNLLMGADADRTVVFSGGACNYIGAGGTLERNEARDELNAWLDVKDLPYFDPQIHPLTHSREYVYEIDGPAEQAARAAAKVTVYEVGDGTLAGVTCMEVIRDALQGKNVVVWLTGACDEKKRPVYKPAGFPDLKNAEVSAQLGPVVVGLLGEMVKVGTNLRKNLPAMTAGLPNVKIVRTLADCQAAIESFLND